jgi:hypothetical protein
MGPPAIAIAKWIERRGAASSSEILAGFRISQSTLRRRRAELRWLGIVFVERGHGSFYATEEVARQIPPSSPASPPDTSLLPFVPASSPLQRALSADARSENGDLDD